MAHIAYMNRKPFARISLEHFVSHVKTSKPEASRNLLSNAPELQAQRSLLTLPAMSLLSKCSGGVTRECVGTSEALQLMMSLGGCCCFPGGCEM